MKKYMLFFSVALLVLATGCLKDKVDNPNTGFTSPDGVMFTKSTVSVGLTADATPQAISTVYIALNSASRATSDVTATVVSNPDLVPSSLTPLPASAFTFASNAVIKAGAQLDTLDFTVLDASSLDPNIAYGVAFTITGASSGVQVASNSKTVVVSINIKNKYDGVYTIRGIHNRSPYNFPYSNIEMELITTGPSSVAFYVVDFEDFGIPIGTGPGATQWSMYGGMGPNITFDPATNAVIGVEDYFEATDMFLGPVPGDWNPSTKEMHLQIYYTTGAGQDFSNRGWSDTLTYVGPR